MPDDPEIRIASNSALCTLGMRPQLMTGFLVQILRQHFADRNNIEHPELRIPSDEAEPNSPLSDYLWRTGDSTGILIESITRWTPELASRCPAVVVKRNNWNVERRGIGDLLQGSFSMDGYDRYTTFMSGSHTLFCQAKEGAETELLAAEIYRLLIHFGATIRKSLDLHRFVVAGVGGLHQLEDHSSEAFVVPITVAYAHEESWVLKQHVPRLRRISLTTNLLRP